MPFTVTTETATGTQRVPLDALGTVGALTYTTAWPGGPLDATWTMDLPASFSHYALIPGRYCTIRSGYGRVWAGTLTTPDRPQTPGSPWTFHAAGLQAQCGNYAAIDGSGNATIDPNVAVDAAITRGLPVKRPATLPTPTLPAGTVGTVADLLNVVAAAQGQRWKVGPYGNLTMSADSTTPDYVFLATDTFGRTLDGYATKVFARFTDSSTSTVKIVAQASAAGNSAAFGTVEQVIDLGSPGLMTAAQAQTAISGIVSLIGQRLSPTGSLTVQPGQLLSPGGVPVHLSTVQAGKVILLAGAAPDTVFGEVNYTSGVRVPIGQTDYDTTADTLQITPVNPQRDDLTSLLTALFKPLTAGSGIFTPGTVSV